MNKKEKFKDSKDEPGELAAFIIIFMDKLLKIFTNLFNRIFQTSAQLGLDVMKKDAINSSNLHLYTKDGAIKKYDDIYKIMDDHYYVNTIAGIPTIDIIEYDPFSKTNFNKHWHTHADNMNNVDRKTLKAVGQTVMRVIYSQ